MVAGWTFHNTLLLVFTTITMNRSLLVAALLATAAGTAAAYSVNQNPTAKNAAVEPRRAFLTKAAAASMAAVGALPASAEDAADEFITTESGMKYKVLKEGTGAIPEPGQTVKAHYTGWLDGFDSPKKFDSSRDRGRPFTFRVGAGQVIR